MLTLFYGQSLFMFVQIHSPDPPSHLIPSIPQEPGSAAGNDVAASNMMIWPLHLYHCQMFCPPEEGIIWNQAPLQHFICLCIWKYISKFGSPFECGTET